MLQKIVASVSRAGYGSYNEIMNTQADEVLTLYHFETFLRDYEQQVRLEWKDRNNG